MKHVLRGARGGVGYLRIPTPTMKFRKIELLLVVIPVAILVLSGVMMEVKGPYHLGLNIDPEYQYLFNSLNLATFKTSTYVDHPGTTLQLIGAAVIWVKWFISGIFTGWQSLPVAVLSQPESYLRAINVVLVMLLGLVSYLAGRQIYRLSGSALAAIALQLSPLLYLQPIEALNRVAPELPEVIAALALVLPLAPVIMGPGTETASRDPKLAVSAGVLLALGIASKANFFTLGIVVFLFKGNRQRLRFLAACAGTVCLLLLPIATELPRMKAWFIDLAIHAGHWGHGPVGPPSLDTYAGNISKIHSSEPFLVYFLFYYLVVFLVFRRSPGSQASGARKALLLGSLIIIVHMAVTAKQYQYHYILPAVMITVLLNASLVHLFQTVPLHRQFKIALVGAGLLLGYEGLQHSYKRVRWYEGWKQQYKEQIAEVSAKREEMTGCVSIGYFRSSLPTFALSLGNEFSGFKQREALSELYPGAIQYSIHGRSFRSWSGQRMESELERLVAEGRCVLLQGEAKNLHLAQGFQAEPVVVPAEPLHGAEGLYRLRLNSASPEH